MSPRHTHLPMGLPQNRGTCKFNRFEDTRAVIAGPVTDHFNLPPQVRQGARPRRVMFLHGSQRARRTRGCLLLRASAVIDARHGRVQRPTGWWFHTWMGDDSKKLASSSVFNALGLDLSDPASSSSAPPMAAGQVSRECRHLTRPTHILAPARLVPCAELTGHLSAT